MAGGMETMMTVATIPFAVGSIGLYAANIWSKKPNQVRLAAIGVAVAAGATIAGAHWLPHVIAGISIGAFASLVWGKWADRHAEIYVLLAAIFVAIVLGAGWILFPLGFISFAYLMSSGTMADPGKLMRKWHGTSKGPQPIPAAQHFGIPQEASTQAWPSQTPAQPAPAPVQPAQPTLTQLADSPRLPTTARNKVLWIEHNADSTLAYLRSSGSEATRSEFTVEQIRDDYAPTAVRAYLALPAETADTREIADGKTGADLLDSQLDTLLKALEELRDQAADQTATQLLAHQQFLDNKFGHRDDGLQL